MKKQTSNSNAQNYWILLIVIFFMIGGPILMGVGISKKNTGMIVVGAIWTLVLVVIKCCSAS